ncbi:MAG: AAA family ATPase [Thermoguttaceae bacterium]
MPTFKPTAKPKILPIGEQNFKSMIECNRIYVDKTEHIYNLITTNRYYFLSRPRRFGKSLLLTTMKYLFLGEKELFKNLYVYDSDWQFDKYPVIDFYFNAISYREVGLQKAINGELVDIAKKHQLDVYEEGNGTFFRQIIRALYEKHGRKVVILIDEYDKPILENLESDTLDKARENRDILRDFYGAIKSSDEYIQFFFMTGVSKFSQLSIFSQLNNLKDITLNSDYATICGFTEDELKQGFGYYIDRAQEEYNGTLWEQLRAKYNGFSWNGRDFVYNPFSYLQFLDTRDMLSYWTMSGTPKFLIDLLRIKNYDVSTIGKETSTAAGLLAFDFEHISTTSFMFQTGYLTIKEKLGVDKFLIDFPNQEVKESLTRYLLTSYTGFERDKETAVAFKMCDALRDNQFDDFMRHMKSLFASIPYQIIVNKEAYFHSIFYMICRLIGFEIACEVSVSTGRVDATIQTEKYVYVIEFKIDAPCEEAIAQIVDKKYAEKFVGDAREVFLAGICFDTQEKKLSHQVVVR